MKYLLLIPIFVILLMPNASAWFCDGEYDDCGPTNDNCCVNGNIAVCIPDFRDCSQRCCIGGGCDTWDDFWFCADDYVANCDVDTPQQHGMQCCPVDTPIWDEALQTCIQAGWECTWDGNCGDTQYCSFFNDEHLCQELSCNDMNPCTIDTAVNHECVNTLVVGCCQMNGDCADNQQCVPGAFPNYDPHCELLDCNDNDECTTDTAVNHACVNTEIPNCGEDCGTVPTQPCAEAVWNPYPTCSWDTANCEEIPIDVSFEVLMIISLILGALIVTFVWRFK